MNIHVYAVIIAAALSLCACASDPIPKGYSGPVAHINDSFEPQAHGAVAFYYLDKLGGRTVENGLTDTLVANSGRGFAMSPVPYGRDVPAQPSTFTIVARTHYAAPILDLTHRVYQVSGDISFTPQPSHTYTIKGILAAGGSSVWIEDETGAVIDRKIEKQDAALGLLQK